MNQSNEFPRMISPSILQYEWFNERRDWNCLRIDTGSPRAIGSRITYPAVFLGITYFSPEEKCGDIMFTFSEVWVRAAWGA